MSEVTIYDDSAVYGDHIPATVTVSLTPDPAIYRLWLRIGETDMDFSVSSQAGEKLRAWFREHADDGHSDASVPCSGSSSGLSGSLPSKHEEASGTS